MKKLALLVVLSCVSTVLLSQDEVLNTDLSHPHRYQLGVIATDLILPTYAAEFSYYVSDKNSFGIYGATHQLNTGDPYYDNLSRSYGLGFFHRYIFQKSGENSFTYLKHGLRYTNATLGYNRSDWFPYQENGYELLIYEERRFSDNLSRVGYHVTIGIQDVHKPFYLEYYAGLRYETILNKEDIFHPVQKNTVFAESRWLQEGLSPVIGIIIGLGLKP